jgi:hypothetical protein
MVDKSVFLTALNLQWFAYDLLAGILTRPRVPTPVAGVYTRPKNYWF